MQFYIYCPDELNTADSIFEILNSSYGRDIERSQYPP